MVGMKQSNFSLQHQKPYTCHEPFSKQVRDFNWLVWQTFAHAFNFNLNNAECVAVFFGINEGLSLVSSIPLVFLPIKVIGFIYWMQMCIGN